MSDILSPQLELYKKNIQHMCLNKGEQLLRCLRLSYDSLNTYDYQQLVTPCLAESPFLQGILMLVVRTDACQAFEKYIFDP